MTTKDANSENSSNKTKERPEPPQVVLVKDSDPKKR